MDIVDRPLPDDSSEALDVVLGIVYECIAMYR